MEPVLQAHHLSCNRDRGDVIFSKIDFTVNVGDIIMLQGKSGSGKTTLLKCLAHLNLYEGQVLFRGRTPNSYGIPAYRTRVLYIPQRPSLLPGTPRDFLSTISTFRSRTRPNNALEVSKECGLDADLWNRDWSDLSGGEAQRMALSVAIGLNSAEVLLLDEPTSALDSESSLMVERLLTSELHSSESAVKAMVWITHSEEQRRRVGTRFLHLLDGKCHEESCLVSDV